MSKSRVVIFDRVGGPDVLQLKEHALTQPGIGEVRVRITAIGVNRAEVMFRSSAYAHAPAFLARIGCEAAGVVNSVGFGVKRFELGDRMSIL